MKKFKCNEAVVVDGRHRREGEVIEVGDAVAATLSTSLFTPVGAAKAETDPSTSTSEKK